MISRISCLKSVDHSLLHFGLEVNLLCTSLFLTWAVGGGQSRLSWPGPGIWQEWLILEPENFYSPMVMEKTTLCGPLGLPRLSSEHSGTCTGTTAQVLWFSHEDTWSHLFSELLPTGTEGYWGAIPILRERIQVHLRPGLRKISRTSQRAKHTF